MSVHPGAVLFLALVVCAPGCGADEQFASRDEEVCLTRRDGAGYCIEVYEASRRDATATDAGSDDDAGPRSLPDRLPWTDITWEAARELCRKKGRRLCDRDEWIDACDGQVGESEGLVYTYGNDLDASRCNVGGAGVSAGGSFPVCLSPGGTLDQSGNVWEWTGNSLAVAAVRGGGWRSSQTHRCVDGDSTQIFAPTETSNDLGFRCCRDE